MTERVPDADSRNKPSKLAKEALEAHPKGMDTRAIARHVIEAKGLDAADRHLRKAIAYKIVQVLRRQEKRGEVSRAGKKQSAVVWQLADQAASPRSTLRSPAD